MKTQLAFMKRIKIFSKVKVPLLFTVLMEKKNESFMQTSLYKYVWFTFLNILMTAF